MKFRVVQIAHGTYLVKSHNNGWTLSLLTGGGWMIIDHRYECRVGQDSTIGKTLLDAIAT